MPFDLAVLRAVNTGLSCAPLDALMKIVTWVGEYAWLGALALPWLYRRGEEGRRFTKRVLPVVALTWGLSNLFRATLDRPRPFRSLPDVHLPLSVSDLSTNGFPSGHAANAFGVAVLVALIFGRRAGVVALVVAALVGFSRVYLGIHYPSDVVAGALLGAALAFFVNKV